VFLKNALESTEFTVGSARGSERALFFSSGGYQAKMEKAIWGLDITLIAIPSPPKAVVCRWLRAETDKTAD
jgi:hypothetical protein